MELDTTNQRKKFGKALLKHENGVLGIILVALVAALGGLTKGIFLTPTNASNILLQSATRGLVSIGQLFVILTAGIDLSVGGLALLTMMIGASFLTGATSLSIGPLILMVVIATAIGLGNGLLVSRIKMPPLIVTLASWQIMQGAAWGVSKGFPIRDLPPGFGFIGQGSIGPMPVATIAFIVVAIIAYLVLKHTTFGRSVYAIGGNPASAWLSGVNVGRAKLAVYGISGLCAGLAGLVIASRIMAGSLTGASGLEMDSIAAVCIGGVSLAGGRGSVIGVVIGVFILGMINNGMNLMAVHPALQSVVKGIIIVVAVAVDYIRRKDSV